MELDKDFRDLLFVFNEKRVRYLVVGGFAHGFHAESRGTKDLTFGWTPIARMPMQSTGHLQDKLDVRMLRKVQKAKRGVSR